MTLTFSAIASFAAIAALLVMSPGPNGVLIARTVPTSGKLAGFANIAGFMLGFYLHGLMAILGISAVIMQSANLFAAMKFAGAIYLAWIGFKALREAVGSGISQEAPSPHRRKRSLLAAFVEGLMTNALNPKVAVFYLAAMPQFVQMTETGAAANLFTLVAIHSLLNLVWFGLMVLVFSRLSGLSRSPRLIKYLKGATGIVFLAFGARLATLER